MTSAAVSTDGMSVVIAYSENLTGTAEEADYAITVDGGYAGTISAAAVGTGANANKVTLTMSAAIPTGATVTNIVYDADEGSDAGSIKDAASTPNNAASQTLATVTNNSTVPAADETAPSMTSAAVSTDGLSVVITYSENLTGTAEAADYAITVDGGYAGTISAAVIGTGEDANKVTLTMSAAILGDATVTDLAYSATGGTTPGSIKDAATPPNSAETQTLAAVTNSSNVSS
jgi:uncharacterized repeat protein (TIGR02059 family)